MLFYMRCRGCVYLKHRRVKCQKHSHLVKVMVSSIFTSPDIYIYIYNSVLFFALFKTLKTNHTHQRRANGKEEFIPLIGQLQL